MFTSYLTLQVHLGPSGEEQLYNISMTSDTGPDEGSLAILRNIMRQNSSITVMNMEKTIERCTLVVHFRQSMTLVSGSMRLNSFVSKTLLKDDLTAALK